MQRKLVFYGRKNGKFIKKVATTESPEGSAADAVSGYTRRELTDLLNLDADSPVLTVVE